MSASEVAHLREQCDLEYQAGKRALEDPTIVAPHPYITRHMELMWEQMKRIQEAMEPEEAKCIVFGTRTDTGHIRKGVEND